VRGGSKASTPHFTNAPFSSFFLLSLTPLLQWHYIARI